MNKKDLAFYSLIGIGLIMAFILMYWEYLAVIGHTDTSWVIMPLEMLIIGLFSIAVYVGWPSDLSAILSLCMFGSGGMGIMIELENLQPYITQQFMVLSILIIIFIVVALFYLNWAIPKKNDDLFDVEVVELYKYGTE